MKPETTKLEIPCEVMSIMENTGYSFYVAYIKILPEEAKLLIDLIGKSKTNKYNQYSRQWKISLLFGACFGLLLRSIFCHRIYLVTEFLCFIIIH